MIRAMTTTRVLLAEALGTFFLCFAGIAAILCTAPPISAGGGLVAIALAHGLALSIAVNNFGGISGAHFNPAVTLSMLVTRRIAAPLAGLYIVAQLLGATIAAITCREVFPPEAVGAAMLGLPLPAAWATTGTVFCVEFVLTFLLVTSIFGVAVGMGGWEWRWMYWVAPILGGCAASLFYHHVLLVSPDEPPAKEEWVARGRR